MLNQVVLVGRLTKNVKENENIMTLAVGRNYKNDEGIYETDFIECTLVDNIAEKVMDYCSKGDCVGVRGRLENNENGETIFVCDKVTFLTSKPKGEK